MCGMYVCGVYVVAWWRGVVGGGEGEENSQATDARGTAFSPINLVIACQTPPLKMYRNKGKCYYPSSVPSDPIPNGDRTKDG